MWTRVMMEFDRLHVFSGFLFKLVSFCSHFFCKMAMRSKPENGVRKWPACELVLKYSRRYRSSKNFISKNQCFCYRCRNIRVYEYIPSPSDRTIFTNFAVNFYTHEKSVGQNTANENCIRRILTFDFGVNIIFVQFFRAQKTQIYFDFSFSDSCVLFFVTGICIAARVYRSIHPAIHVCL